MNSNIVKLSEYIQRQGGPTPAEMGYPGVWENKGVHNIMVEHPILINPKVRKRKMKEAKKKGMTLEQLYPPVIPAYLWVCTA